MFIGISIINHPAIGVSPFMETSLYGMNYKSRILVGPAPRPGTSFGARGPTQPG